VSAQSGEEWLKIADDSIASALCGVLLKTPKADDALLLYS
jgi:hypothetical protein